MGSSTTVTSADNLEAFVISLDDLKYQGDALNFTVALKSYQGNSESYCNCFLTAFSVTFFPQKKVTESLVLHHKQKDGNIAEERSVDGAAYYCGFG